jgi:hypothetical protein
MKLNNNNGLNQINLPRRKLINNSIWGIYCPQKHTKRQRYDNQRYSLQRKHIKKGQT